MCEEYNGWTNRETWAVALYINNDQGWQESVYDALRSASEDGALTFGPREAGEIVRENVEQLITVAGYEEATGESQLPAQMSQVAEDIGSLYRVNWDEIGANFLAAIEEDGE